ncbi:MAG TPA: hypothetical protein PLO62_05370 [Candidatus Hydrogenedentes bacterium]|nr:hypothetical protein [Candidatus Hydrogenedentota bacterium]
MTTLFGQKNLNQTLDVLFTSKARVAVLRLLLLDPVRPYYQRQVEAATALPLRAVQRELDRLTTAGLLYRRVEGNRTYYHVDRQFPLFPELRAMFLKTGTPLERFRGALALEESVRLAFLIQDAGKILVVSNGGKRPVAAPPPQCAVEAQSVETFVRILYESPATYAPYLSEGVDVLGRRDDVVWRHIEAAGFTVAKAKGVA